MAATIGLNFPWWAYGDGNTYAKAQYDETLPRIVRDPQHKKAAWDYAASKGLFMLLHLEATGDYANLSWAATHPAFCGVVELSNEPFWNGVLPEAWVTTWGPVIDQIKSQYPQVKMLAPVADWSTSSGNNLSTSAWTQRLLAARPALKTEMYGWAVHPYYDPNPQGSYDHTQNVISALKANGVSSPRLWATEIGWSRYNTSEGNQAAYAQKFLDQTAPLYEAVFWYQMNDNNADVSANREYGFGLYKLTTAGWDATWPKAQVWTTWRNAISISPSGDFRGGAPPPPPPPPASTSGSVSLGSVQPAIVTVDPPPVNVVPPSISLPPITWALSRDSAGVVHLSINGTEVGSL